MFQFYFIQIIATGILILLLPLSRVIAGKLIFAYGIRTLRNEKRVRHIMRIVKMLINFTFVVIIAVIWGVTPENVLLTLSSIFAVIGVAMFAQWSILSNVTAGIIIFFTTPFKIGDTIEILDKDSPLEAVIEDIFTFHIHLRTSAGELVIIPNSLFMQKMVSVHNSEE